MANYIIGVNPKGNIMQLELPDTAPPYTVTFPDDLLLLGYAQYPDDDFAFYPLRSFTVYEKYFFRLCISDYSIIPLSEYRKGGSTTVVDIV